jgi:5,5'-dehydrodivanillate O-demethylase
MITKEENERLTQVGPGTAMGALLRRYWYPVAATEELRDVHAKRVRLLGEDLVLHHDRDGGFGLHAEGPNAERYVARDLSGLVFGYLGPHPVPELARLDGFVLPGMVRMVGTTLVPCNWLQIMENSLDPVHTEWLHGHLQEWVEEQRSGTKPSYAISRHHVNIAFEEFEYGIYKRRLMQGQPEDVDDWRVGHPVVFPCTLAVGSGGGLWTMYAFQIRVPMDDTHTMHYWYTAFAPPAGAHVPPHLLDEVPHYDVPCWNADGEYNLDLIDAQDVMAWVTQGPIAKRELEKLGWTDRGVILLRKVLARELDNIARGADPMGVIRRPHEIIELPVEHGKDMFSDGFASLFRRTQTRYYPYAAELLELFKTANPEPAAAR